MTEPEKTSQPAEPTAVLLNPPLPSPYQRLYLLALEVSYRQDLSVADWAANAQLMAGQLAAGMGVAAPTPAAPAPAPNLAQPTPAYVGPSFTTAAPSNTPQKAGASQFGPAFDGWNDAALRRILVGAQALVIGRENGANDEQQRELWGEIEAGVLDLENAHRAAQG